VIGIVAAAIVSWWGWAIYYAHSPEGRKASAESEARRIRMEQTEAADKARSEAEYEARHKYTGDTMDVTKMLDGTLKIKNRRTGDTVVSYSTDGTYVSPGH
jgi:hypothetical protein